MARLSGVRVLAEKIEFEGAVYETVSGNLRDGDVVRANSTRIDITEGAFYRVEGDHFVDDGGDKRDFDDRYFGVRREDFTLFRKVSETAGPTETPQYREVKRQAKVGERIRIVAAENTYGKYKNGDEFTVKKQVYKGVDVPEVGAPGNMSGYIYDREYVVLEPVTAQPDRLKVGEYAKVIDANGVDGDRRVPSVVLGEIREIIEDDGSWAPFRAEKIDGSGSDWFREAALVRATTAEVDEAKRKQFAKGDKVRLISGGGEYPLNGFKNGEIYEARDNDDDHDHGKFGKLIEIETVSGKSGFARPDQLEKVSEAEAEEAEKQRPQVGDYVKILVDTGDLPKGAIAKITEDDEDDRPFNCELLDGSDYDYYRADQIEVVAEGDVKWAAIGRKPNEYKKGDIVEIVQYECGAKVGELVAVKEVYHYSVGYTGGYVASPDAIKLVYPVESRFDVGGADAA